MKMHKILQIQFLKVPKPMDHLIVIFLLDCGTCTMKYKANILSDRSGQEDKIGNRLFDKGDK